MLPSVMLDTQRITDIAQGFAHTRIAGANLERVFTETTTDSQGEEAVRITLVLHPDAVRQLTGDVALDLLVGIQDQLMDAGEDRLAMIEYATEEELEENDEDDADSQDYV